VLFLVRAFSPCSSSASRHDDGTGERDAKSMENWKAYKEKAEASKLAAKASKAAAKVAV
jgi:hypothetical protein